MLHSLAMQVCVVSAATLSEALMAFAKCHEVSGCQEPCQHVFCPTNSAQFKKLEIAFCPRERRDCAVVQEILSHLVGLVEKMDRSLR